ncbi:calcium-binding protein, partial [Streptomyces sp. NPDC056390]|uniref:calcium-binding protein n=1 Tax=Streptomyces sp. NPDC056390 TaxID=3345806 RepID=UPI0035DC6951
MGWCQPSLERRAGHVVAGVRASSIGIGTAFRLSPVGTSDANGQVTISYEVRDLAFTTTGPLPGATQNSSYSTTLQTTGGTGNPTFAVTSGALPPGLTLNTTTGAITGTATTTGTFTFSVTATDSDPDVPAAVRQFTITIQAPTCATATPTITGTNANVLIGTAGDDVVFGLGGSDYIDGRGGNDILCCGTDSDRVIGGDGNDPHRRPGRRRCPHRRQRQRRSHRRQRQRQRHPGRRPRRKHQQLRPRPQRLRPPPHRIGLHHLTTQCENTADTHPCDGSSRRAAEPASVRSRSRLSYSDEVQKHPRPQPTA